MIINPVYDWPHLQGYCAHVFDAEYVPYFFPKGFFFGFSYGAAARKSYRPEGNSNFCFSESPDVSRDDFEEILLEVLLCSIAVYVYELRRILMSP